MTKVMPKNCPLEAATCVEPRLGPGRTAPGPSLVPQAAGVSPQLLSQQLIHNLWVSLAFRGLHNLADKEAEHGLLARTILLELLGIPRYNLVNFLFQCGDIGRLLRPAFFLVDGGKIRAPLA